MDTFLFGGVIGMALGIVLRALKERSDKKYWLEITGTCNSCGSRLAQRAMNQSCRPAKTKSEE